MALASAHNALTDAGGVATLTLQVTLQPGDNFRIAASTSFADIAELAPEVVDVPGPNYENLPAGVRLTDMLTVWRKLHVEMDAMAEPPAIGAQGGKITGHVKVIQHVDGVATKVFMSVNLEDDLPSGEDLSENLSSLPPRNGRFEKGTIVLGIGEAAPGRTTIADLKGNGMDFVEKPAGFEVPVRITKEGSPELNASVKIFFKSDLEPGVGLFELNGLAEGALTAAYIGGTLNVAGVTGTIDELSYLTYDVKVKDLPNLPFELRDDDATTMPALAPIAQTIAAYHRAFIDVVADGGGNPANNKNTVAFVRNIATSIAEAIQAEGALESHANRAFDFWVGYVLQAWEGHAIDDLDANSEAPVAFGETSEDATRSGSLVFAEVIRDAMSQASDPEASQSLFAGITVAHEIGHQFGLSHDNGGLMGEFASASNVFFDPRDLDLLRSRQQSPGS